MDIYLTLLEIYFHWMLAWATLPSHWVRIVFKNNFFLNKKHKVINLMSNFYVTTKSLYFLFSQEEQADDMVT